MSNNFPDLPQLFQLQSSLWQWPRSGAAVLVGAGFSLNAVPKTGITAQFPMWKELVRTMFDQLHPFVAGVSNAQDLDDRFNRASWLRVASEFEAAFGPSKLEHLIRTQVPDASYLPGLLHEKLMKLPWTDVFTTNYDTLLERTPVIGRVYTTVSVSTQLATAPTPRIVKLHGCFQSNTTLVITEEHFRRYLRDCAPFVNTVQQSLLENCIVLLGFSGDDPNFLTWTGWIRDELNDKHAPIYLVGPNFSEPAERALLARRGVTPIDLGPLFKGVNAPEGIHAASIGWFLDCLMAARPPRPENWPNFD